MAGPTVAPALDIARYYGGAGALIPECVLGTGMVLVLVVDAFRPAHAPRRPEIPACLALAVLAITLLAAGLAPDTSTTLFSGMVVVDPFARFFRILFTAAGLLGVILAMRSDEVGAGERGEYYSLLLGLVLGMMLLAEASDIVMLYLAVEIVSLFSYVLAGFRRHERRSAEAALKYVIYGGTASGAMLFGLSILYGVTGETQLSLFTPAIAATAVRDVPQDPLALTTGLGLAFSGFAYKIAAVPLHMWSPDVYEGAPTPFTAFLSTGPKAAGFAALLRFLVVGFADPAHAQSDLLRVAESLPWPSLLVVVSVATMITGNLAAIGQAQMKRFLAYSSIAHAGYALIGLAALSPAGAASVALYLAFYVAMNIGAFFAVIWFRERAGAEQIEAYRGLGHRAPFVAVALTICLFSLTGLPPFAGFVGKYYLFAAAIERGLHGGPTDACAAATLGARLACWTSGSSAFYALAIIGVLNSAVSLYYYARVVRNLFLERPRDLAPIPVDRGARVVLGAVCAFLVIGGVWFGPLASAARAAIRFQRPTVVEVRGGLTPTQVAP